MSSEIMKKRAERKPSTKEKIEKERNSKVSPQI